jgi:hypothetical protein
VRHQICTSSTLSDAQRCVSGRRAACRSPPASWWRAATRTTRTTATSCGTQVLPITEHACKWQIDKLSTNPQWVCVLPCSCRLQMSCSTRQAQQNITVDCTGNCRPGRQRFAWQQAADRRPGREVWQCSAGEQPLLYIAGLIMTARAIVTSECRVLPSTCASHPPSGISFAGRPIL